jgi:hypothetical protein
VIFDAPARRWRAPAAQVLRHITPGIHFCVERDVNEVLTQFRAQFLAQQEPNQVGNVFGKAG